MCLSLAVEHLDPNLEQECKTGLSKQCIACREQCLQVVFPTPVFFFIIYSSQTLPRFSSKLISQTAGFHIFQQEHASIRDHQPEISLGPF